ELGEADRRRVENAVTEDSGLGEQVSALRADKARLVSLYGGGLNEPIPREWINRIEEASRRRPPSRTAWAMLALAASFVLVLSGTVVWRQIAPAPRNDVVADALAARTLEQKPDYVVPVSTQNDAQAESAVMAKSLDTRVKAPDLTRMGYRL